MGILDTALQKLSDPASSISMAEDTIRDMRHRQENAMGRNADRASAMFRDIRAQSEAREGREHEAGLQGERLGVESELHGRRLEHESDIADRQIEAERDIRGKDRESRENIAESELSLERELEEARRELESTLNNEDNAARMERLEHEWGVRLEIARLERDLMRERMGLDDAEDDPQSRYLQDWHNEMMKLQQMPGSPWIRDPDQNRFDYSGELTPEIISQAKERIFDNIRNDPSYEDAYREQLIDFIDSNFGLMTGLEDPGGSSEGPSGGIGSFGSWSNNADDMNSAMGQTDILNPNYGLPNGPGEFWPNVGESLREEPEWAGPVRGGWGREERVMEMDIKSTIDRLRGQSLTPAEEGVVDHVEQALTEEVRKHPGVDSTSALQELLQLLSPIDSGQDEARRPGTGPASGGRNFRE